MRASRSIRALPIRTIDRVTITPGCVEGTEQPKISHRTEKEGEAPQPSLPADSAS